MMRSLGHLDGPKKTQEPDVPKKATGLRNDPSAREEPPSITLGLSHARKVEDAKAIVRRREMRRLLCFIYAYHAAA